MERHINRIVIGCGSVCGLMIGSGHAVEGLLLGMATLFGIVMLRVNRQDPDAS